MIMLSTYRTYCNQMVGHRWNWSTNWIRLSMCAICFNVGIFHTWTTFILCFNSGSFSEQNGKIISQWYWQCGYHTLYSLSTYQGNGIDSKNIPRLFFLLIVSNCCIKIKLNSLIIEKTFSLLPSSIAMMRMNIKCYYKIQVNCF